MGRRWAADRLWDTSKKKTFVSEPITAKYQHTIADTLSSGSTPLPHGPER